MKYNDNSDDYAFYGRRFGKESGEKCYGHRHSCAECGKGHESCGACGKDICIKNNPVIKVFVNGSECEEQKQFLSSYMEALGSTQTVGRNSNIVFDVDSLDSVGENIELDASGTVFTINRTGLYHVEWNLNLGAGTTAAVIGIIENGEPASGSATVRGGNFASGTLIQVESVPFTLSLHNYGDAITIEDISPYEDSAISIRIVRFADGPS